MSAAERKEKERLGLVRAGWRIPEDTPRRDVFELPEDRYIREASAWIYGLFASPLAPVKDGVEGEK